MKVADLYPQLSENLRIVFPQKFPEFYRGTLDIEVRPWSEYIHLEERYDVNPEVFENRGDPRRYARKVLGVSFIRKRIVSFRDMPPAERIFIHEIGHVHFRVSSEQPWNEIYGGAEILFWLILEDRLDSENPDQDLKNLVEAMKLAHEGSEEERKYLLERILTELKRKFGFGSLAECYRATGTIPDPGSFKNFDLKLFFTEPERLEPDLKAEPFRFLSNLLLAGQYGDPNGISLLKTILPVLGGKP